MLVRDRQHFEDVGADLLDQAVRKARDYQATHAAIAWAASIGMRQRLLGAAPHRE